MKNNLIIDIIMYNKLLDQDIKIMNICTKDIRIR